MTQKLEIKKEEQENECDISKHWDIYFDFETSGNIRK
jgi:hypothetical protein